ncbi:hypothetical protein HYX14_06225 [Candidatus Woesearchaeota archaeon]|nr:hypothetical protein [Candidatus Woesearchaeota archaeon]
MTKRPWQEIVQEQVPIVLDEFYHPLVQTDVTLEEKLGCGTAYFDFRTNRTHMATTFLDDLHEKAAVPQDIAVRGVLKHEFGHYHHYPRECDVLMFFGHFAEGQFGKHAKSVVAYWVDIMDNLPQVLKRERGKDIRELYRGMNTLAEQMGIVSAPVRELLKFLGVNADDVAEALRTYSVDRLLTAYYQHQGKENLGVDLSDNPYLQGKLEELLAINYLDMSSEIPNFVLFGTIVDGVLQKLEERLPKVPEDVLKKLLGPAIADAPDVGDFSDDQIEGGLDKIIRKWGKERYGKIRDYVQRETGKRFDQPSKPGKSRQAGLESSELGFHDDQITYYDRLSRTYGLYIHKKPLVVDVQDTFPEGQERFHVGDAVRRLNPYSTGGRILPGITTRYKEAAGTRKDKLFKVPNLLICEDTSGSMSGKWLDQARLAGFILARNYHANEAEIGVMNFSVNTAFLLPTRELPDVYSMLCAYWGGGTFINIPKIQEYIRKIGERGSDRRLERMYTSGEDYQQLVERLPAEQQREFIEKNLTVKLKEDMRAVYEKLDTAIITDGYIANIDEVIAYINQMAVVSRNTIFLIGHSDAGEWDKLSLPNTQIIPVDKPEDLVNLAIGKARRLVPEQPRPASLFYME